MDMYLDADEAREMYTKLIECQDATLAALQNVIDTLKTLETRLETEDFSTEKFQQEIRLTFKSFQFDDLARTLKESQQELLKCKTQNAILTKLKAKINTLISQQVENIHRKEWLQMQLETV